MGLGGIIMVTKSATKAPVEAVETISEKASKVKSASAKSPAESKAVEKKVPAENKATGPRKTEAKASAKKEAGSASAKKPAVKKEIKVKTIVEYYGKQVEEKDIIASVKKAWTRSGKKVGDIKSMELYIKPEEAAVYYVINKTETGAVAF